MKKLQIICAVFLLVTACDELNEIADVPVAIQSGPVTVVGLNATAEGELISTGDGVSQYGHVWSTTSADPIYTDATTLATRLNPTGSPVGTASSFTSTISLENGNTYKIRAYAIDIYGSAPYYGKDTTIFIAAEPVADFTFTNDNCTAPCTIVFSSDESANAESFNWSFGDGNSSTLPNPQHEYIRPGIYSVVLEVTGPGGTDQIEKTVVIQGITFERQVSIKNGAGVETDYLPILRMADNSYVIGIGSSTLSHVQIQLVKFDSDGIMDSGFNYFEDTTFSEDCRLPQDLLEVNGDILLLTDCAGCYEFPAVQIDGNTGDTTFITYAKPLYGYIDQRCEKILSKNLEFTLLCTGLGTLGNGTDRDIYSAGVNYLDYSFYCMNAPSSGKREDVRDGIFARNDDLLVVGYNDDNQLLFGSFVFAIDNDLTDLGYANHDPVSIEAFGQEDYLIIGNYQGAGVFAITLNSTYSPTNAFTNTITGLDIHCAMVVSDSSFVIGGEKDGGAYLAQFSGSGSEFNRDWERTGANFMAQSIRSIDKTNDDGFIMSGASGGFAYIIKTDFEGKID